MGATATALILAAGEGTRMKSALPKVAHRILDVPMVSYVVRAAEQAGCGRVVVVTGHGAEAVEGLLSGIECVRQGRQLGTGHAVMCARDVLEGTTGSLLVLSGDSPLIGARTLSALVEAREERGAGASVLTAHAPDPAGYGRVVRDDAGAVAAIVEEKDCAVEQRAIDEVNTGAYCFDAEVLFEHLETLTTDNVQGEFYLTDMVGLFVTEGLGVASLVAEDFRETLGVNSRVQLAEAAKVMQRRINERHMLAGVTMTDPELVWIGPDVEIGRDTEILPMTFLTGETRIGTDVLLGPDTRVTDSIVSSGAVVDSSVLVQAEVGPGATVGPVAYLRPGTVLGAAVKVGSCVEMKNSSVGEGSKVPHLSYIGDATIGKDVNVGAGSITCNYDGYHKYPTVIEDGAFIGSDTMLVAPVRIGKGAVTGAASAISRDVPAGALGIERCEQREIEDWAAKRRARRERE